MKPKVKRCEVKGDKFMRGGIAGDVYSLQNPEQFKELITIYNDLSEKSDLIKGYYLDHTDNSIVFLTEPNISDLGKDEIYGYVEPLKEKGFSIIDFDKSVNYKKYRFGLDWGIEKGSMVKQDGKQGKDNPQWFKLYLKKQIKFDGGGQVMAKESYEVGDKIRFKDKFRNEEHDGIIDEINERGTYVVGYGSGLTTGIRAVQKEEVIGAYPKVEAKKKRFSFFDNGGEMGGVESKYSIEKDKNGDWMVLNNEKGMYVDRIFNSQSEAENFIREKNVQRNLVGFESYFAKGGGVEKGYNVFNYTDNVYATDEVFKTKKLANEFIKEFRNRFSRQGYYRDNQMNKIAIEDIDLLAIPTDFSPFRKMKEGGSIAEGNYHMILSQAKEVKHHVDELQDILKKEDSIEAWVVAKMENVSSTLSDITHYLDGKSEMPKAKRGMKVGENKDELEHYSVEVEYGEGNIDVDIKTKSFDEAERKFNEVVEDMKFNKEINVVKLYAVFKSGVVETIDSEYREDFYGDTYENEDYEEYAEGGETRMAKRGMKVDKIEYPSISLKEKDLNDDQAEIYGFIENYEPLNRQMDAIRKNLMTKIARGQFDEKKAPKIFIYLIDNGLKSYEKLHGDIELSKKEKEEMANNMVIDFMSEAEQGNYENETFLPKKYLAEDGIFIMTYDIYDEDGQLEASGLLAQDVVEYANLIWYYDMLDEDGEEIDDFDVAKDYLEQYDYQIKSNSPKSATNKKKVRRASVK